MFNLARTINRPGFSRSALIAATGSLFAMLVTVWISLCGSSAVSLTALTIGFTIGFVCCEWSSSILFPGGETRGAFGAQPQRSIRISLFMALLATIWLTPLLLNVTLLAGCETFWTSGTVANLLVLMFPGLIVAMNTVACGLFLRACNVPDTRPSASDWICAAAGCLLMMLHGWFTVPMAATVTIVFFVAAVIFELFSARDELRYSASGRRESPGLATAGLSGDSRSALAPSDPANRNVWISTLVMTAASTMLVISATDVMSRLIHINLPLGMLSAFWVSLIVAVFTHRTTQRLVSSNTIRLLSFATLAAIPWAYSTLVDLNLSITSGSSAVITMVLRSLQIAIVCAVGILPLMIANSSVQTRTSISQRMLAILLGMIISFAALGRGISAVSILSLGLMTHVAATWWMNRITTVTTPATMRRLAVTAAVAMAILPAIIPMADEYRASSLLFSPRTVAAIQRGVSKDLIEQSDANRLVERIQSQSGHLSVWRRAGHVYEFQRDGIALGRVSTDTSITPQPPEEILPAIMALVSHPQPGRILIMGDDTGVCLRTSTHFPVQEIVALRGSEIVTSLARRYTWNQQEAPADQDARVKLMYLPLMLALRDRSLKSFDVIVAAMPQFAGTSSSFQYTSEFYESVRDRLTSTGVFCQRLKQSDIGPQPIKQVMASLMEQFEHVGVIQTIPGDLVLLATNSDKGLVDPQIMTRLQRDHVKQEIATTGMDWSQVAVLPLMDANDPIGMFSNEQPPRAISIGNGGFSLCQPIESIRKSNKGDELRTAFGPHQVQLISAVDNSDDSKEAQRRLSSLQQQLEILAGMPDQPWTYRKSLRMEMQRDPRAPVDVVKDGQIVKRAHPLDDLRKDYFVSLGNALQLVAESALSNELSANKTQIVSTIDALSRFTNACEPLMSHFAHYEIIRLHELAGLQSFDEELKHRLHIVFFSTPSDASVRPVISALEQLVDHPELISSDVERYDLLNSLIQKLIERWEARTAWEPKSALRVQNDVEKSVRVVNLAMDQMEKVAAVSDVANSEFLRRRRYITAALISPLRDYRDQVLAHRMKMESARDAVPEPNTEDASDLPLLITPEASAIGINTN